MDYKFSVPEFAGLSDSALAAAKLGALAGRLSIEQRTIVYAPDGRAENVSEHSHMVGLIAVGLAEHFPTLQLNADRLGSYGLIHDAVEAYVGDTPTYDITDEGLQEKETREAAGLKRLREQFAGQKYVIKLVEDYEAQLAPEARFVRMVDKLVPLLTYLNDDCASLIRRGILPDDLLRFAKTKMDRFRNEYPDMIGVLDIWQELAEFVAARLAQRLG